VVIEFYAMGLLKIVEVYICGINIAAPLTPRPIRAFF